MDTTEPPPLATSSAPVVPPLPTNLPAASAPKPKAPPSTSTPPLAEEALKYMETVRRHEAFTHTTGFQELLNQGLGRGFSQASPQRSLFRHPGSAFGVCFRRKGHPLLSQHQGEPVATLPAPLSLDPLILTSKHYKHQPYTCHAHLGSALNLLP